MSDAVVADVSSLEYWLFDEKKAEVLFVEVYGEKMGFALFFHNFSAFLGRAGIYLEDLYVRLEHRGKGYGKAAFKELARIAVERGCGRMEWNGLVWIGISRVLSFISLWGRFRWMSGRFTGLRGRR